MKPFIVFLTLLAAGCASRVEVWDVTPAVVEIYPGLPENSPSTSALPSKIKTTSEILAAAPVALAQLVQIALESNPSITAARRQWEKATEKYPQETSLPDPMLTYMYVLTPRMVEPERHRLEILQTIPFPQKLYLKGEIAITQAQLARLSYERTIRDVVAQVQRTYYELAYMTRAIDITQKNQKLLEHFVRVATVEYAKAKTPLPDLLRAQSQQAQMNYDLIRLEELRRVEEGALVALLDQPHHTAVRLQDLDFFISPAPGPFEALYNYALGNRQELLAAAVEITRADHELSLALNEYFPDLSLGFSWTEMGPSRGPDPLPKDGDDMFALSFGVNLPIWYPKRNAQVREARAETKSAAAMKKNLENELAASLKRLYYKATNARRLVELYQNTLLPQAQHSISIAENWHRDGEGSLLGVLEVQTVYLNFSLALARAQSDYAQSLVELAQMCGGRLPDNWFAQ